MKLNIHYITEKLPHFLHLYFFLHAHNIFIAIHYTQHIQVTIETIF